MAYMITEECIACGACESECPNEAISEGDTIFKIDPARCTECVGAFTEPQCVSVCPVDAPAPDLARKESKVELLEKWKGLHPGESPAEDTY